MTATADRGMFLLTFVKAVIVQPNKHVTFKTQAARVEGALQVLAEHGAVFHVTATEKNHVKFNIEVARVKGSIWFLTHHGELSNVEKNETQCRVQNPISALE